MKTPPPPKDYWAAARTLTSAGRLDPLATVEYQRALRIQRAKDVPPSYDLETPNMVRDLLCALVLHVNAAGVVAMDTRDLHLATGHGPDKIAAGLAWAEAYGYLIVYRGKRGKRLMWMNLGRPQPRRLSDAEGPAQRTPDPKRSRGAADRARVVVTSSAMRDSEAPAAPVAEEARSRSGRRTPAPEAYVPVGAPAGGAEDPDPILDAPFPM